MLYNTILRSRQREYGLSLLKSEVKYTQKLGETTLRSYCQYVISSDLNKRPRQNKIICYSCGIRTTIKEPSLAYALITTPPTNCICRRGLARKIYNLMFTPTHVARYNASPLK